MPIQLLLRESRIFAVSSSPSTPRSLSAPRIPIFQQDPFYLHSHPCRGSSANGLLQPSRCNEGNCCHGQRRQWVGLDTLIQSRPLAVPQTGTTLPLDPMTTRYVSGTSRLVPQSATH